MSAESRCRGCGNLLPDGALNGLCPVCLLREGLAGDRDNPARSDTGPFMSGTNAAAGALASLDRTLGGLPHVLLRDSELSEGPGPLVQPGSPEMPAIGDRPGRLQLLGEIARGGMGAVLKGRDPDLGRDVAVKVLLESHHDKPDLIRRFIEEAQIGGQLQHPGIVPIYELGAFADRRPFFAMKLVKGRTLSSLLDERSDRVHVLPRFLSIFEAVCQTIAYAHARGVIHRDLKPSNIMVGSFGEVQVMDWGLAKVLPQGGAADDVSAGKTRERETVIATARSAGENDSDLSKAGSVMGTPCYMAPEQARGEVDRLDERCDVFALGSILCELLTDEPAFTGRSSGEIQRKASRGELNEALDRLDGTGSDAELTALAKDCLASELEDRPRHAGEVAARINAYQTGVQERLRQAEIARAEEKARAEEATKRAHVERDRLRLSVALAASVLGLVVLGAAAGVWAFQQRQLRASRLNLALHEAEILKSQAEKTGVDLSRWASAREAAKRAESLLSDAPDQPTQRRVAALVQVVNRAARAAEADMDLIDRLVEIRSGIKDGLEHADPDVEYPRVFQAAGLELDKLSPAQAGAMIKARPPSVAIAIAAALDHWASARRSKDEKHRDLVGSERLTAIAAVADPDPWRNRLRRALSQSNPRARLAELLELSRTAKIDDLPAVSLDLLGEALAEDKPPEAAVELLRKAQVRHPGDFWVNLHLANALQGLGLVDEAIRFFTVSRALRPGMVSIEFSHTLAGQGKIDEAIAVSRDYLRMQVQENKPIDFHILCLHDFLTQSGRSGEAEELRQSPAYQQGSARLTGDGAQPENDAPPENLREERIKVGNEIDDPKENVPVGVGESIILGPKTADAHTRLGNALRSSGWIEESIVAYRTALHLEPRNAEAHFRLGRALIAQSRLDMSNGDRRDALTDEAIAAYRSAVRHKPDFVQAQWTLGNLCYDQRDDEAAITAYRAALRQNPKFVEAHFNLGNTLARAQKLVEAIAAYNEAIKHKSNYAKAYNNLGTVLDDQREREKAIAAYREAIRLDPKLAESHYNLGLILRERGDPHAIDELRKADELGSNLPFLIPLVREIMLADRLPAILKGDDHPRDNAERLQIAALCYRKALNFASARLYAEALSIEPKLADDLAGSHRYNAACAAALAGCGRGKDEPSPDEAAKAKMRKQAIEWLKADLDARSKPLKDGKPADRAALARTLRHWKVDRDLAGIRDEDSLKKLPEDEHKAWQAFWSEVAVLLKNAEKS